jgi:hypothetical protein
MLFVHYGNDGINHHPAGPNRTRRHRLSAEHPGPFE